MSAILTREQMVQEMIVLAERSLVLGKRAKDAVVDKNRQQEAMTRNGISPEMYDLTSNAYLAGFTAATQPWMDLLKKFKEMPLYHQNGKKE
jgi:hypothetical protein